MNFDFKNETTLNIVKHAKKGSDEAIKELIRREQKDIYATLKYLDAGISDIPDLVQEILVKMAKNITKLKDEKNFKVWLNRITVRHFYDYLRRSRKYKEKITLACEFEEDEEGIKKEFPDYSTNPIKCILEGELDFVIKNSINKLPEPFKITIVMRELQGLSYDEIAKITKTNVGTVKSRIARARCKLKEYIMPYIC